VTPRIFREVKRSVLYHWYLFLLNLEKELSKKTDKKKKKEGKKRD